MVTKKGKGGLIAACALALSVSATAGGLLVVADAGDGAGTIVAPVAKYEFQEENDLGKDSMGNWPLKKGGTVTKSANGAHFDGSSRLYAEESQDISETLTSFTLNFTMTPEVQANDARTTPVGFGWNDWNADMYCWFTLNQHGETSDKLNPLRFSTHGGGDGTTGRDWGKEISSELTAGTTYRLTLTAEVGGKATVYLNGASVYSYPLPESWNLKAETTTFAIGGDNVWTQLHSGYFGEIGAVTIYDFSMSASEVAAYWEKGQVTTADLAKAAASETDLSKQIIVEEGASKEEILQSAPAFNAVSVTMNDKSVRYAPAYWNDVVVRDGNTYLEGTLKGLYNPDGVKAYAKIGFTYATEIMPVAKYEFKDANNPGKDSMGNYDLVLTPGVDLKAGTVTVENGVATFNGTAGLISPDRREKDISEALTSFTLYFEMKTESANPGWAAPVSFGWNDWNATKWATFHLAGTNDLLRFSAANALVQDGSAKVSDVDGTGNAYWGKEIGTLGTEFHKVALTVQLGGKIVVYLDGISKYSYDLPENFTLKDGQMAFALGASSCWENAYDVFYGSLKNVSVYDFALTAAQLKTLGDTQKIKTNSLVGQTWLESADVSTLAFENEQITTGTIYDKMPVAEKISLLGNASVQGSLTDGTKITLPILWTDVTKSEAGVWTAYGHAKNVGLGIPSALAEKSSISQVIEVKPSFAVTVAPDIAHGKVAVSASSGIPGDVVEITATPDAHYVLEAVLVNGEAILPDEDGAYKTTIADKDVVVSATFKGIEYTISADEGIEHGNLTFSAEKGIYGEVVEVTPVPDAHYVLTKMYVNDEELPRLNGKYSFKVTGNMRVTAVFAEAVYTIDCFAEGHGTASASKNSAKAGETITVTVAPQDGYEVASVTLNGTALQPGDEGVYSFIVEGDAEINVTFKALPAPPPDSSSDTSSDTSSDGPSDSSTLPPASDSSSSGTAGQESSATEAGCKSGCGSVTGISAGIALCGAAAAVLLKKRRR